MTRGSGSNAGAFFCQSFNDDADDSYLLAEVLNPGLQRANDKAYEGLPRDRRSAVHGGAWPVCDKARKPRGCAFSGTDGMVMPRVHIAALGIFFE
jgi:hypothetical protein